MKNAIPYFHVLVIISLFTAVPFAQKYTEGKFEYGLVKVERIDGSEVDSTIRESVETAIRQRSRQRSTCNEKNRNQNCIY